MCIFVPSTVMSSWEHVAAVSCSCLTDAIPQRIIGQARYIIAHWYYGTRLLISSFAGCKSFLCAWTHYTVLIIASLVTSTLYANGTVTRQSIRVHQWCLCLNIYGTMIVINNTSSLQSLCVTIFIGYSSHRCSLTDDIPGLTFPCSWLSFTCCKMPSSMFLKSHCAWTHTVWTGLLSKMSWRHSMCLVAYHNCSWSYIRAAATWCDWTHYTGGMF